ncbi:synaptotagmin-5-like protein isoform X1, partial [Tanacetum coccineum]
VDDIVDPIRDLEVITEELRLKVKVWLESEKDIRLGDWKAAEIEILNVFQLLTAKPVVYMRTFQMADGWMSKPIWNPVHRDGTVIIKKDEAYFQTLLRIVEEILGLYCSYETDITLKSSTFCIETYVLVISSRKEVGTYLGFPVFSVMSMKFLSCNEDLRNLTNQQVRLQLFQLTWLNAHLTKIWSYVDEAASDLIKANLEPVLKQYRPTVLSSLTFFKLTLGTAAPQFTGSNVKEEAFSRKDILEKINKWSSAREEETWIIIDIMTNGTVFFDIFQAYTWHAHSTAYRIIIDIILEKDDPHKTKRGDAPLRNKLDTRA